MNNKYKITINITLGATLLLLGCALVWVFYLYPEQRGLLVFSSSVTAGLSGMYAAFYIAQTLHENIRRDTLHRSIEMIGSVGSPEMSKVREFIRCNLNHNELPKDRIFTEIYGNSELHHAVRSVLNQFEGISICIQHGYVDESVMFTGISEVICYIHDALTPYILGIRKEREQPTIFCEFVKLANSWASGRYLYSGEKLKIMRTEAR